MDVRLPDGTIVTNVPEGITQSELMRRVGLMSQAPKPEPTFMERVGTATTRGLEAVPESVAGIGLGLKSALGMTPEASAQAAQIRKEKEAEQGQPQGLTFEELQKTYSDKGLLEALKKAPAYVTEQILQSAPSMAVPMAVGAGAAAVSGPFAPIVGPVAGIGTYGLQQFGQFMRRQAEEGATGETLAPGKAAVAAATTAPIGYFADRLTLGLGKIPEKVLSKEVAAELAKRAGANVGTRAATGATLGVVAESPTEVLEQMAERWQAGLPLTNDEAMREYKEAFFGAAAVGGVGGAAARAFKKPEVAPEPKPYEPPVSLTGATPEQMFRDQMAGREGIGAELTTAARERAAGIAEQKALEAEQKAKEEEQKKAEQAVAQERAAGLFAGQGPQQGADLLTAARERATEQEQQQTEQKKAEQAAKDEAAQAVLSAQLHPSPEMNTLLQNQALNAMGYVVVQDEDGNNVAIPKPRDIAAARAEQEQRIAEGRRQEGLIGALEGSTANADLMQATRERLEAESRRAEEEQKRKAQEAKTTKEKQKANLELRANQIVSTDYSIDPVINRTRQAQALDEIGYDLVLDKDGNPTPKKRPEVEPKAEPQAEEAPPFVEATPIKGEPAPALEEVTQLQKSLDQAEKERRRFTQGKSKGMSLWTALRGKLTPEEVNDIGPGLMFKALQKKGGVGGVDISTLVADGKLNDFLPPDMRPDSARYDEQESVEHIKEKARRQDYYTFETKMAIRNADMTVEQLERAIRELLTLEEVNLEIQRAVDEQRAIDEGAQETAAPSEAGTTEERQGENETPAKPAVVEKPAEAKVEKPEAKAEKSTERPPILTAPPELKLKKGRNEQVVLAARELAAGNISKQEYDKYVDYYTPIAPVLGENLEAPIDDALMTDILTTKIKQKKKPELINAPIEDGTRVGLRMDIPALEWSRQNGVAGSVVSVHKGASPENKTTGSNIAYTSTGHVKDAVFAPRDPNRSFSVAQNLEGRLSEKTPQQTIEGDWINTPPDQLFKTVKQLLNNPEWSQVSLDPTRHAYFYDRATKQPVVSADEVMQVGRFVLAKNVKFAPREEFLYSAEGAATGFNTTKENREITKAIEGKSLVEVSKWAIDNAPNAVAKYFAQKVYDRIKQMEARGIRFGFEVLTSSQRPVRLRNARGVTSFIWGTKAGGEDTTINIVLNGPTVVENQSGYPPGVEYRTILHELLHVATRGQLHFLKATDPLVKEIRDLYNKVATHFNQDVKSGNLSGITKDFYNNVNNAFTDPDEMVSWGITDERMQKYMFGIKVGEGNAFSKLVNLVRRVLGFAPPYESALDRLITTTDRLLSVDVEEIANGVEQVGYNFGPGKRKATTGEQQSLFSKKVQELFANQQGATTAIGNDALNLLERLGRTGEKVDNSYKAKVREAWDNAKDNPKATAQAAGSAVTRFLDQVQTWAFSSDAALNNAIRRAIMNSTLAVKDKVGHMLNASLSQSVHADALASLFITEGKLRYNKELHKWEAVKDENNFVELSRSIDKIAEKYGLSKEQAERIAHTAFEAKRLKSIVEFNNQIDMEVAKMKAEAKSIRATKPVASSALTEKANRRENDKKYIHRLGPEEAGSIEDQIAAGMSYFGMMPELNESVKIWNNIRSNAVGVMVESGMWTEDEAEFMLSNGDYVPFFREEQLEQGGGPKEYIRGLMVQAKEKKFKGTDKPVNDIFDNMIRWTQYSINRAVKNKSAVSLIDAALLPEVNLAKKVKSMSDGDNVVRVWRNGEEDFYDMADPMFIQAFTGLESIAIPSWKWAATMSNWLRQSVVMYPLFSVAQVPQDSFAAMFSSGLKPRFALTIPARAVKEFGLTLANRSKAHEDLKKYGVVGVRDFTSAMVRMDAEIYAGFKARPGVVGKVKDFLSHIAMASDNAVRQAVYTASIDQGLSKSEALEKSFEIWNVRRKGTSKTLALAGQVIPFFNAYLAAQNVAYKTITGVGSSPTEKENAHKTLLATTGSVMALSLIYAMMNGDDDDYLEKPAVVRDRLLMVPGTGGVLTIPLRSDLFTMPKVITEHMYLLMTDKGYEDGRKFRSSIANIIGSAILSPTAVPQIIKPMVEVGINYNFFTGRPLIGEFEKKKETERQFTETTSELAKMLTSVPLYYSLEKNRAEGLYPIAIDHLVRGMFGSAGGLVIYMTNPILHSDPNVDRPSLSLREAMATLPGTSGFVSREYESGLKNDFYVLRDEVAKVANTMADLKARSPEQIDEYLSKEENLERYGLSKGVAKITDQLGKIRKNITRITNTPNSEMSPDEKQAAIKEMREVERELLRSINTKALRAQAKL